MLAGNVRVGCSGWNYRSWKGRFYPARLPSSQWLPFYARTFDTVEVNATFYRLPSQSAITSWRDKTPPGFLLTIKASRYLTHMKRLLDPVQPLERLFTRVAALKTRLGPVLYQLPASMPRDLNRLERFLESLPRTLTGSRRVLKHAMEFRHLSWYVSDTYSLLERYGVVLCLHDKTGSSLSSPFVGPFAYVRFHGTSGHYSGSYTDRFLRDWASRLAEYAQDRRSVFAYFNNDVHAAATRNAVSLRHFLNTRR